MGEGWSEKHLLPCANMVILSVYIGKSWLYQSPDDVFGTRCKVMNERRPALMDFQLLEKLIQNNDKQDIF